MRPSREHALHARHSSVWNALDQAALRQGLGGQQRTESFFVRHQRAKFTAPKRLGCGPAVHQPLGGNMLGDDFKQRVSGN
jgi:hypothetical protein